MESPFKNDPFTVVAQAFSNLYPDKRYMAHYNPDPIDSDDPHYGETVFPEDGGVPTVLVCADLPITDAVEIFAHELAHVAAGNTEESHGTEWETAFEAIFNEYERIGKNLFSQQEEHKSVLDDC